MRISWDIFCQDNVAHQRVRVGLNRLVRQGCSKFLAFVVHFGRVDLTRGAYSQYTRAETWREGLWWIFCNRLFS